jgi:NAD(P)H-hydrate epimerase
VAGLKTEGGFVYLTAEEMAEADRTAIEDYGIDVLALMENAGLSTANLARRMLGGRVEGKGVCALVGKGNNGGDGLVAARHLHNWGAVVQVVLAGDRSELRDVPARQAQTVGKMGIPFKGPGEDFGKVQLLIDALLGYGSKGNPREPVAGLIRRANASRIPILAVDIPSGMDATTGEAGEPCIDARATVTFGLPKTGFLNPTARTHVGELYLADISMPRPIYTGHSQRLGVFEREALVRVW